MKPLHLEMTAFSSYKEKAEIDFRKLGDHGVFVISGDTGAGKTSIFEAILFALYGRTNDQDEREILNLRNRDVVEDKIETKVVFEFENKAKKYTILRSFKPTRSKDKVKKTIELTDEDGVSYTQSKEVSAKIAEIIGLDFKQFQQVVMIAQGAFKDLLVKKGNERADLLKSIFDIHLYSKFVQKSKQEVAELTTEVNQSISKMEDLFVEFDFLPEEASYVDKIELLKESFQQNEMDIRQLEKNLKQKNLEIQQEAILLEKVKEQKRQEQEHQQLLTKEAQTNALLQKVEEEKEKYLTLHPNQKIEEAKQEFIKIKEILPLYQQLDEKHQQLAFLKQQLEKGQKDLIELENQFNQKNVEKEELSLLKTQHIEGVSQASLLEQKITQDRKNLEQLREYKKTQLKYEKEKGSIPSLQAQWKDIQQDFESKNQEYDHHMTIFLQEQAGILAETLVEGSPCPVCGSSHHPNVAIRTQQSLSKEELEGLKREVRHLDEQRTDLSNHLKQKNTWLSVHEALLSDYEKELNCARQQWESLEKEKSHSLSSMEKEWLNQKNENKKMALKLERKDLVQKEMDSLQIQIKEKLSQQQSSNDRYKQLEGEVFSLETRLGPSDYHKQELYLHSLDQYLREYQKTISKFTETIQQKREEISTLVGQRVSLEKRWSKEFDVELSQLEAHFSDLVLIKNETEKSLSLLKTMTDRMGRAHQKLGLYYDQFLQLSKEVEWKRDITKLYNFGGMNKNKLSLESFVLSQYLDQILWFANERFREMSQGQYELRRTDQKNAQTEQTLGLDVVDLYQGQNRPVTTLSGGESFMASLSLALGMADAIRSMHGGIEMETIFIDEGFGTLDEETLKKVLSILEKTAGEERLVGVISHVRELKERIEKKIVIQKNIQKGSTITVLGGQ